MASSPSPYRSPVAPPKEWAEDGCVPDADLLVLFAVLSPGLLALVVSTAIRGEAFGAGPTICGGVLALGFAMAVSAWRARG